MSKFDKAYEAVEDAMGNAGFDFSYRVDGDEEDGQICVFVDSHEIPDDTGYYMREIASVLEGVDGISVVDMEAHETVVVTAKVDSFNEDDIELEISKEVPQELRPSDVYELVVRVMHGDADHFDNLTFIAETQSEVKQYINLFDNMLNEYPNGRGGGDNYYHIEGFDKLLESDWPWDVTDEDSQAGIKSYKVYYYDEDSKKFEVKIKRKRAN
ncbi:MAG: Phi14:2 [Bacillales bacterium]|jgi:hypothetical protein|nr:Phi14:2 [Bacillales bacterium]